MITEILYKMEERRQLKGDKAENGVTIYKSFAHDTQRSCRKSSYYNAEIKRLEATHNPPL